MSCPSAILRVCRRLLRAGHPGLSLHSVGVALCFLEEALCTTLQVLSAEIWGRLRSLRLQEVTEASIFAALLPSPFQDLATD